VRVSGTKNAAASGTELVVDAFSSRDSAALVSQPAGDWRLVNTKSGKDLTPPATSTGLTQFTWSDLSAQRWNLTRQTNGTYFIGNVGSGMFMDVAGEPPFPLPRPALQCILRLR
jgi:hypothetical protein